MKRGRNRAKEQAPFENERKKATDLPFVYINRIPPHKFVSIHQQHSTNLRCTVYCINNFCYIQYSRSAIWNLLLLLATMATASSLTATVSVNEDAAWITERACGQKCVWIDSGHIGAPYPDIVMHLNCGSPYLNACFCRADFGTSATTFLSSCVSSRCESDGINDYGTELFSALSIYSNYCSTAAGVVFAAPSVDVTSASSISATAGSASASVRTTATSTASSTSSRDNSASQTSGSGAPAQTSGQGSSTESSSSGLSTSAKIGLAVGLSVGILAIILGVGAFIWHKRRKRAQQNSHYQTQPAASNFGHNSSQYASPIENKYNQEGMYSTQTSELGGHQRPRHELGAYQGQRSELSS